jgi:osmotically-inducible protein OsmY
MQHVVLHGTVDCCADHQLAELLAGSTPGVNAVDNELSLLIYGTVIR